MVHDLEQYEGMNDNRDDANDAEIHRQQFHLANDELCAACLRPISEFENSAVIRNDCGHFWCQEDAIRVTQLAAASEKHYPPQCCRQPFNTDLTRHLLDDETRISLDAMERLSQDTNRLYCANPKCNVYLERSLVESAGRILTCLACQYRTCTSCKKSEEEHFEGNCPEDKASTEVEEMAKENGWKHCPVCQELIERHGGCHHVVCRLGHAFCWLCLKKWRTCTCPQFENGGDLEQAQLEEGIRLQYAAYDFDNNGRLVCHHGAFFGAEGEGRCQGGCGDWMPYYLMHCYACPLMICAYCQSDYRHSPQHGLPQQLGGLPIE